MGRAYLLVDPYGAVVAELPTEEEAVARREELGAEGVATSVMEVDRVITNRDPGDENDRCPGPCGKCAADYLDRRPRCS